MDRKSCCAPFLFCLFLTAFFFWPALPSLCFAKDITIAWDAGPEPDLEGYVIYCNIDSPGPPFKYADDLLEDELDNPLSPQFTITGLNENSRYYLSVTAYDTQGNESCFSDQLCVEIVDSLIESCGIIPSNCGISSESSGGGGCFISGSAADTGQVRAAAVIAVLLGLALVAKKVLPYKKNG